MNGIVISAIKSGSGKTTAALAVMKALKDKGFDPIPFKVGPDFIDPSHYKAVCGVDGRNIDSFMMKRDFIRWNIADALSEANAKKPFLVAEGVMGLFDGYGEKGAGSTAEIAKLLNLAVILVIDVKGMGQSVLPIINGFMSYDKDLNLAGVILNNAGSERHVNILKTQIKKAGIKLIGAIKKEEGLKIKERHLGIIMGHELSKDTIKAISAAAEGINIDNLLAISRWNDVFLPKPLSLKRTDKKIYIAQDEAFSFCYRENIRVLESIGDVSFFSPLRDNNLSDASFIYLPGGYPELYAEQLSSNKHMMAYLKDYVKGGGYLLAECGGFIYLSRTLKCEEKLYNFCGIFPFDMEMGKTYSSLGYVIADTINNPIWGNSKLKGHRFHYSYIKNEQAPVEKTYLLKRHGQITYEGYSYKNATGSYVHLHFGSNINAVKKAFKNIFGG